MKIKFYYIHGLHGSNNSKKFLKLQKQYINIECVDWTITDNINQKLSDWEQIISSNNSDETCIIASSTGANYAAQLRYKIKLTFIRLVLINPLFDIEYLFDSSIMPQQLKKFLVKFEEVKDSLILISLNDEVIDNVGFLETNRYFKNNNQIIIDSNSTHSFENLNLYYKDIDLMVNSLYS